MKFAMFRRRQAFKVTSVAAVPIHGLERHSDGVLLHLGVQDGKPIFVEVPRAHAGALRDYLRKTCEALDFWEAQDALKRDAQSGMKDAQGIWRSADEWDVWSKGLAGRFG